MLLERNTHLPVQQVIVVMSVHKGNTLTPKKKNSKNTLNNLGCKEVLKIYSAVDKGL